MTPVGPEYRYVEKPSMELLAELGWSTLDAYNEELGETGTLGRDSHRDVVLTHRCLLYTSPSPRDATLSRMPSSA